MTMLYIIVRWLALAALCFYGFKKKSLTVWIFISMLVGAEIGYDFPDFAIKLKVISTAFLKLIKTIIAPLLFGTLVVGIAGHSNIKQVGRMGIKSLLYFEVVTTIALFLGLAAINLSKAGVGINFSSLAPATDKIEVVKQTPSDIFLHIFVQFSK